MSDEQIPLAQEIAPPPPLPLQPEPPPAPPRKTRLKLEGLSPEGSFLGGLGKLAAFMGITGLVAVLMAALGVYGYFSPGLPQVPTVADYRPPVLTEMWTQDDVLNAEFYAERRKLIPYDQIPKRLVQAFVASEDGAFFDHFGFDPQGILRAAYSTLVKRKTQGGSTITQQTAKAILISSEGYLKGSARKLTRKVRELILSLRLEKALTKEQILYLYLNNVYLGHHAYGVQAAAENYYRKDVRDLTLAEMALIAGLPQAPSAYSPFAHPDSARNRRRYVLDRMLANHMVTQPERDEADNAEIKVFSVEDVFRDSAPFFTEHVRKDVVKRYGNERLLRDGLKVYLGMDSEKQRAAQTAMLRGLIAADKRQGFPGPLTHLDAGAERTKFLARVASVIGKEELKPGEYYVGLVTLVDRNQELIEVSVGTRKAELPLLGMRWAHKPNPELYYPKALLEHVGDVLKVGDVILVRAVEKKNLVDPEEPKLNKLLPDEGPYVQLEQEPSLEAAVVSVDPDRGYVVAMTGGYDFDASEFNRAFQACRQPGSSFKPILYSAAIDQKDFTAVTKIVDGPIVFDDPDNQRRWKPENFDQNFKGDVLMRNAVINSWNIPAVKTLIATGVKEVAAWAHHLGITTEINEDLSMALGSSCVKLWELTGVYTLFNQYGKQTPVYFTRKIEDRFGRALEDHTSYDDPWAPLADRVAAGYARLLFKPEQIIDPTTAFLMTYLMSEVVDYGTAIAAKSLGKPAAGKTGTTNDSFDAWFMGFTQDLVTGTWVGYDTFDHSPLGRYETGGRAALPIWIDYMRMALGQRPQEKFETPPPGADVVFVKVNPDTGELARPDDSKAVLEAFKRGKEPTQVENEPGKAKATDFMKGEQ